MKEEITTQEPEREQLAPDAIYKNNIYALVDDVKNDSQFLGLTDEELKENKSFFPRLIHYIYINYIGDLLGNRYGKQVIYKDINQLDNLFNIYIELVNKYKWNNKPFIVEFSNMIGISRDTIYRWLNGSNNNMTGGASDNEYLTRERSDTVRKWVDTCEGALLNGASQDTIRDIFILKARHGYSDRNNDITITVNHKNIISAEDLPALIGVDNSNN